MTTPDDDWVQTGLTDAAPLPKERCILDPHEFDAGRLLAWQAGVEDEEVDLHLAQCSFCRSLLPGLAMPQTDAMTRALADQLPARRNRVVPIAAALVCAAAIALFALRPNTALPIDALRPAPTGLEYSEARFSGGLATTKSEGGSTRFTPQSTLRWVLRPPSASARAGSAQIYQVGPDGRLAVQAAQVKLLPTGAVRIVIQGAQLPKGDVRLIAVVTQGDAPRLAGTLAATLPSLPAASIFSRQISVVGASD
jgi:hypothetical protein